MKNWIVKTLEGIRLACLWAAILASFVLFGVVAFNIIGRAIFDATGGAINPMIFGAIEVSQYALMLSIFAAIPAMLGTGMIRVDILSQKFPAWLARFADRLWILAIAAFAAVLVDAFFELARTAYERGDVTQDLRLPLWPFYGAAALECLALVVLAVGTAFGLLATPQEDI